MAKYLEMSVEWNDVKDSAQRTIVFEIIKQISFSVIYFPVYNFVMG